MKGQQDAVVDKLIYYSRQLSCECDKMINDLDEITTLVNNEITKIQIELDSNKQDIINN